MGFEMNYVDLIGFLAGTLTTLAYVPQLVRTLRTKSTKDLSAVWLGTVTVGTVLWVIYGGVIGSYPIIVANSVSVLLALSLLYLKLKLG